MDKRIILEYEDGFCYVPFNANTQVTVTNKQIDIKQIGCADSEVTMAFEPVLADEGVQWLYGCIMSLMRGDKVIGSEHRMDVLTISYNMEDEEE